MSHPEFPPLGRYRHFKGGEYLLVDFARHSETQEWMVVYRALYGEGGLWVRPAAMWQGVSHQSTQAPLHSHLQPFPR